MHSGMLGPPIGNRRQNRKGDEKLKDPILGMVFLFASNFAPEGYAVCDGQLLQIQQNTALFSILGTTYGGDGRTTFALPKTAAPTTGMSYVIATRGVFPSRE